MTIDESAHSCEIRLEHLDSPVGLDVHDLVVPALRRNPRRAHLLVSTVLGKHIPTDPRTVGAAANQLGDLVDKATGNRGPEALVLGFAETATGPGHSVAARLGAFAYLHSTRRRSGGATIVATFEEGHSHATQHMLMPAPTHLLDLCDQVILVDDEISTGTTALAAINVIHERRPRARYVIASLVDFRTPIEKDLIRRAEENLHTTIDFISLAQGRVTVADGLAATVHALPAPTFNPKAARRGSVTHLKMPWPTHIPQSGRHGFYTSDAEEFQRAAELASEYISAHLTPDRPVIVVGHEELMFLPQTIARALANEGMAVRYQTTTRSPAYVRDQPGYPLRRGFRFTAPEADEQLPRYLYNAHWTDADAQLVFIIDAPANTDRLRAPGGVLDVLSASGSDVVVGTLPPEPFLHNLASR